MTPEYHSNKWNQAFSKKEKHKRRKWWEDINVIEDEASQTDRERGRSYRRDHGHRDNEDASNSTERGT